MEGGGSREGDSGTYKFVYMYEFFLLFILEIIIVFYLLWQHDTDRQGVCWCKENKRQIIRFIF